MLDYWVRTYRRYPQKDLRQVAARIRDTLEPQTQASIGASTAILAGLLSEESLIQRIIGMDLLEQSTVYQSIKQQGIQRERSLSLYLLNKKLGELPPSLESRVNQLQDQN